MTNVYKAVASDVYQVTLPLPFALNSVNCYLLRDHDGWTILDTGLNVSKARTLWQETFTALAIAPTQVKRIILTHTHPDHYGLAGWLQGFCRQGDRMPAVYMSPREAAQANQVWKNMAAQIERMTTYFCHCGMAPDVAADVAAETSKVGTRTLPHPETVAYLEAGMTLQVGERHLTAIHAPGHSDGQLLFYDAADQVLFCGDHVLIKITPHIGFWPGTEPDPLGRYLTSLQALAALDVRLALTGHRALITDWRGRLAEMQVHHDERLADTLAAVKTGTTVYEVSQAVFRLGTLNAHEARFAVAETLSHLECLVERGHLRRQTEEVWRYYQV